MNARFASGATLNLQIFIFFIPMGSKCFSPLDKNIFTVKIEVLCSRIFIEQASGRFRDECVTFHIGHPFTLRQLLTRNGKPVRVKRAEFKYHAYIACAELFHSVTDRDICLCSGRQRVTHFEHCRHRRSREQELRKNYWVLVDYST